MKLWFQIFSTSVIIGLLLYFIKTPVVGFSNYSYPQLSFFEAAKPMSIKDLIRSFMPVLFGNNWFASTYLYFYMFVPFLNLSLSYLPRDKHRKLIILMMFLGCVLPLFWFQNLLDASALFYFILGFYIASYIRIYNPFILRSNKLNFAISILFCMFFIVWKFVVLKYGSCIPFIKKNVEFWSQYPFDSYAKLPVLLCAVYIFSFFKNIQIKNNKVIN